MRRSVALLLTLTLVLTSLLATVASVSAEPPGNEPFERTWSRTDKPVADLTVSRTWMWGPEANTGVVSEDYVEAPNGTREVQYYDKARMEINNPDPEAEHDLWYVTNGLLVVEMVTGRMQYGIDNFVSFPGARIPVAGDADDTNGPTYDALAGVVDDAPLAEGTEITWRIDSAGVVTNDTPLTGHGVTAAYWDEVTGHTVASPFWDFMNSEGIVWQDEAYVTDLLFENPFYATGRPITEAYWATTKVDGEVQSVLLQCFERRCLTYTPQNEDGWKVEAGNVGQHYYAWRYGSPSETVTVFLVAEGDQGASGIPVGCGDSLIDIERPVTDTTEPVAAALEALFAIKTRDFGESGLTTALYNSNLTVESVDVTDGAATVNISGELSVAGVCDEPRFIEQIRQTVLAAEGIESAEIFINDIPLDEIFGTPAETTTANIYLVLAGDEGQNGMEIGCGDSLIPVEVEIFTNQDPIGQALEILLSIDEPTYDNDGQELINALYQSDLVVAGVDVEDGHATVALTGEYAVGGVCDEPRFIEQIRQTVLQFDEVTTAEITVNGTPIDDLFNQM